jgi:hypothetical protein
MIVVRPPLLIDLGGLGQREAEQIFNLGERENDRVGESLLQVLIEQLVLASLRQAGRLLFGLVQPHTPRLARMPRQRRTLLNKTPGYARNRGESFREHRRPGRMGKYGHEIGLGATALPPSAQQNASLRQTSLGISRSPSI